METYALTVLPFGSGLPDSVEYVSAKMERRLEKHPQIRRKLSSGMSQEWMRQNGLLVPVTTLPIDHADVDALVGMIVRGLFYYEFGFALRSHWDVRVANLLPSAEAKLITASINALGPDPAGVQRSIGGGAVTYTAWHSRWARYFSVWQLTLFGGLKVGGDEDAPGAAFDRWSAITVRADNAPTPPDKDELPDEEGARAWIAAQK